MSVLEVEKSRDYNWIDDVVLVEKANMHKVRQLFGTWLLKHDVRSEFVAVSSSNSKCYWLGSYVVIRNIILLHVVDVVMLMQQADLEALLAQSTLKHSVAAPLLFSARLRKKLLAKPDAAHTVKKVDTRLPNDTKIVRATVCNKLLMH